MCQRHSMVDRLRWAVLRSIAVLIVWSSVAQSCPGEYALAPKSSFHDGKKSGSVAHVVVNRYIADHLPEDLRLTPSNITHYPEVSGDGLDGSIKARIIPIEGLLKNTGQFGHIGLGNIYKVPVMYVDSDYKDSKDLINHEMYEIARWEHFRTTTLPLELGHVLQPNEMRGWIRSNLPRALELATQWHDQAPRLDALLATLPPDALAREISLPLADDVNLAGMGLSMKLSLSPQLTLQQELNVLIVHQHRLKLIQRLILNLAFQRIDEHLIHYAEYLRANGMVGIVAPEIARLIWNGGIDKATYGNTPIPDIMILERGNEKERTFPIYVTFWYPMEKRHERYGSVIRYWENQTGWILDYKLTIQKELKPGLYVPNPELLHKMEATEIVAMAAKDEKSGIEASDAVVQRFIEFLKEKEKVNDVSMPEKLKDYLEIVSQEHIGVSRADYDKPKGVDRTVSLGARKLVSKIINNVVLSKQSSQSFWSLDVLAKIILVLKKQEQWPEHHPVKLLYYDLLRAKDLSFRKEIAQQILLILERDGTFGRNSPRVRTWKEQLLSMTEFEKARSGQESFDEWREKNPNADSSAMALALWHAAMKHGHGKPMYYTDLFVANMVRSNLDIVRSGVLDAIRGVQMGKYKTPDDAMRRLHIVDPLVRMAFDPQAAIGKLEIQRSWWNHRDKINYRPGLIVHDGYNWQAPLRYNKTFPTLFHGTSSLLLENIKKNGLRSFFHPFSEDEFAFIKHVEEKYNVTLMFKRTEELSLSLDLKIAENHARGGPEIIQYFINRVSTEDLENMADADRAALLELKGKYEVLMKQHRPVVLAIQTSFNPSNLEGAGSIILQDDHEFYNLLQIAQGGSVSSFQKNQSWYRNALWMRADSNLTPANIMEITVRSNNYLVYTYHVPPKDIIGIIDVSKEDNEKDFTMALQLIDISL